MNAWTTIAMLTAAALIAGCGSALSSDDIHEVVDGLGHEVTYTDAPESSETVVTGVIHGPKGDVEFVVASGGDAKDEAPEWAATKDGTGEGFGKDQDLWVWTKGGPAGGVPSALRTDLCERRTESTCAP